ncbi:MAG: hypothetical protein OXU61_04165 [Gammaproteobacteria bacterium]|nr:hypothetical protein [Gammaproteobacteria bacterium]
MPPSRRLALELRKTGACVAVPGEIPARPCPAIPEIRASALPPGCAPAVFPLPAPAALTRPGGPERRGGRPAVLP